MEKIGGGWSKVTVLEPDTKKFYNRYFYKKKPAHRVLVETPKANILSGYTLIEKDLRTVLVWLENINELLAEDENEKSIKGNRKSTSDRKKYNIIKGLFVAALTFYGKSFASCEGRKVKLEKSNLDTDFHEDHNDVIEMRHNFAAHSGAKKVEQVHVVLALDKKKNKGTSPYFGRELAQPDSMVADDIEKFINLVNHVKTFVDNKIEVLAKKIFKDDVVAKGIDYWYEKT
ncbi:hypothetical protein OW492_01805 [Psychromonas sp. 14N.309.X.WAT.B.A12]|uniref:hypothetical protein n=1 Tax=Psychromonas sp. 14N.309.X.WAT.B.A12 TaxID=2998322 RepID=UPI0025B077EF|nr:hypothetical protein [Psychromonas sp. 14N.309.X.WAT.B.A12]MDN2662109.1 hypothetical protein [Psychromonas sp. 14N.309.X.WAT.B.A12]